MDCCASSGRQDETQYLAQYHVAVSSESLILRCGGYGKSGVLGPGTSVWIYAGKIRPSLAIYGIEMLERKLYGGCLSSFVYISVSHIPPSVLVVSRHTTYSLAFKRVSCRYGFSKLINIMDILPLLCLHVFNH
jgi:hypothetical protein